MIDTNGEVGSRVTDRTARGGSYTAERRRCSWVAGDDPAGAVYPPGAFEAIGHWAVEHGVWVLTDEIYKHLTYGPHTFVLDADPSCRT